MVRNKKEASLSELLIKSSILAIFSSELKYDFSAVNKLRIPPTTFVKDVSDQELMNTKCQQNCKTKNSFNGSVQTIYTPKGKDFRTSNSVSIERISDVV